MPCQVLPDGTAPLPGMERRWPRPALELLHPQREQEWLLLLQRLQGPVGAPGALPNGRPRFAGRRWSLRLGQAWRAEAEVEAEASARESERGPTRCRYPRLPPTAQQNSRENLWRPQRRSSTRSPRKEGHN